MSVCVRVYVCGVSVRVCVCVLSSWYSSTNLSSIQIFHSVGKRPDSNSIVPWKVHFHLFDIQQNLSRVERSNARTRSNKWGPVMIFTCQIMSNPRLRPRGGGGGGGGGLT